jgi:hypothetical protein
MGALAALFGACDGKTRSKNTANPPFHQAPPKITAQKPGDETVQQNGADHK